MNQNKEISIAGSRALVCIYLFRYPALIIGAMGLWSWLSNLHVPSQISVLLHFPLSKSIAKEAEGIA